MHLVDLVLSQEEGSWRERMMPGASGDMDPQAFKAGTEAESSSYGGSVVKLGGAGGMRMENGTAVIS